MITEMFADRSDAGKKLASALSAYAGREDVVVLALPRGGVAVGFEVACALGVPLDVFMVRKLGLPWHPEVALGAIASGNVQVISYDLLEVVGLPAPEVAGLIEQEKRELERRERTYREGCAPLAIAGRVAFLVDDGVATGSSLSAAIEALRLHRPARVVAAIPVGAEPACDKLRQQVDDLVCLLEPEQFLSVGEWYHDFSQMTDREVRKLLRRGRELRIVASHKAVGDADSTDRAA